jgi:hypothetical protein
LELQVPFWRKTFTPDADIPLVFSFGGAKDVKALGKAAGEDCAKTI